MTWRPATAVASSVFFLDARHRLGTVILLLCLFSQRGIKWSRSLQGVSIERVSGPPLPRLSFPCLPVICKHDPISMLPTGDCPTDLRPLYTPTSQIYQRSNEQSKQRRENSRPQTCVSRSHPAALAECLTCAEHVPARRRARHSSTPSEDGSRRSRARYPVRLGGPLGTNGRGPQLPLSAQVPGTDQSAANTLRCRHPTPRQGYGGWVPTGMTTASTISRCRGTMSLLAAALPYPPPPYAGTRPPSLPCPAPVFYSYQKEKCGTDVFPPSRRRWERRWEKRSHRYGLYTSIRKRPLLEKPRAGRAAPGSPAAARSGARWTARCAARRRRSAAPWPAPRRGRRRR